MLEQPPLIDLAKDWVRTNCGNPAVQRDFIERVQEAEQRHFNCRFAIGPGLTKTGHPCLVQCYSGQLFRFVLTPTQARNLHAVGATMQYTEYLRRQDIHPDFPAYVMLDELAIQNASHLSSTKPIQGSCTYSLRGLWTKPFAFGLHYELAKKGDAISWDYRINGFIKADGLLRFSFPPILSEPSSGTTLMILRLYAVPDEGTTEGRQPFSNAAVALVDVHGE